eukprot:symbB.v1.2.017634.t1/scaffold1340.1/size241236/19
MVDLLRAYFPRKRQPETKEITSLFTRLRQHGRWREVMAILWSCGGLQLNPITLNAALRATTGDADAWRSGQVLFGQMSRSSMADVVSFSTVAMAFERRSKWTRTLALLKQLNVAETLESDVVAYGTSISACSVGKAWTMAFNVFHELSRQLLQVNVVVSTSLLSCYPWSSSLALAMDLASSGMTFNIAMRAALRVDMEDAWRWATETVAFALQSSSSVAINVAINSFLRCDLWSRSLLVLRSITQHRLSPPAVAISTFCANLPCMAWPWTLRLFKEATTVQGYAAALNSCGWSQALEMMQLMTSRALRLDLTTVNSVLVLMAADPHPQEASPWRQSSALLEQLSSFQQPDVLSFHSMAMAMELDQRIELPTLLVVLQQMELSCMEGLSSHAKKDVITANAGDSRAVMCRGGQAVELSYDHKPASETEKKRIEASGGYLEDSAGGARVNGNLNLSRAIGDLEYKKRSDLKPEEQTICSTPDVIVRELTPEDEFIVLACDGIWDVLSNQGICDFVRPRLEKGMDLKEEAPHIL